MNNEPFEDYGSLADVKRRVTEIPEDLLVWDPSNGARSFVWNVPLPERPGDGKALILMQILEESWCMEQIFDGAD